MVRDLAYFGGMLAFAVVGTLVAFFFGLAGGN